MKIAGVFPEGIEPMTKPTIAVGQTDNRNFLQRLVWRLVFDTPRGRKWRRKKGLA
jgi:hypothetical protein